MEVRTIGDSARNSSSKGHTAASHVFDAAGEHVQYHSDSESLASRKSKTRYVNSAVYIETIETTHSAVSLVSNSSYSNEVTPHPHSSYRSNSTPYLTGRVSPPSSTHSIRKSCRLPDGAISPEEETPRCCSQTYRGDGHDTFRLSVASMSTTTTAKAERQQTEQKKREAFNAWLARKEQERREKCKRENIKRRPVQRITPEQREASFRRWMETKKKQEESRRQQELMRQYRESERIKNERLRREKEKEDKLNDWVRKKEEEIKSMKTREERKAARLAIEEAKKRAQGEKAFRDWLRTSKNKPLPVPLNQGELSMRGSISQMYVNPVPWQSQI